MLLFASVNETKIELEKKKMQNCFLKSNATN